LRKDGLRGQAFVIFEDVQAATAALQSEQGFTFFGKDLKLAYAREKSDRIAKRDGTFLPKAKRRKRDDNQQQQMTTGNTATTATATTVTTEPFDDSVAALSSSNNEQPASSDAADIPKQQPTHILFADKLPSECNEMMLAMLFRQYAGFKEVRIPRAGLAFIEFDNEPHATLAFERLNGFKLTTTEELKLTYGKA